MAQMVAEMASAESGQRCTAAGHWILAALAVGVLFAANAIKAQEEGQTVDDMTANYHFLSADDTLAILDEEGKLKGYIEVTQPENESDDVLNYDLVDGTRTKNHVQFRTNRIHGRYYRFSGTVERGKGHEEKDSDYLRLVGDLDTVSVKSDTGDVERGKAESTKETVQTTRVVLKSIGKSERSDE
jgi:hypothetical protein